MKNSMTRADRILTGFLLLIGCSEVANLGTVVLHRSFSDYVVLFMVVCIVGAFGFVFLGAIRDRRTMNQVTSASAVGWSTKTKVVYGIFVIVVLSQIAFLLFGHTRNIAGDLTVETVNTTLATDTVHQMNPMTGNPYTSGIPTRLEMLSLPMLYAALCRIFSVNATTMVFTFMPIVVLLLSYFAYRTLANVLFEENVYKQNVFLLSVSVLLTFGEPSFFLAGARGTTIRLLVIVPFLFSLILRRRWMLVALCILAEACIVWTLYGLGACALITGFFLVVDWVIDLRKGGKS